MFVSASTDFDEIFGTNRSDISFQNVLFKFSLLAQVKNL